MGATRNTNSKQTACKKQSYTKSSSKYEAAIWESKAKRSHDDLLQEEIDPTVEAHMSLSLWEPLPLECHDFGEEEVEPQEEAHMRLSSTTSQDLAPIPLESHDIAWECEYDETAWEHLFQLARSDSDSSA